MKLRWKFILLKIYTHTHHTHTLPCLADFISETIIPKILGMLSVECVTTTHYRITMMIMAAMVVLAMTMITKRITKLR
jgi:hypothetical protein